MEEEFAALITNNTWDLVSHLVGSNVVTDKWIFKQKFNSDGSSERYKACWVLHSFTQRPDVDYNATFSLVVKSAMVRTVLFLTVSRSWLVFRLMCRMYSCMVPSQRQSNAASLLDLLILCSLIMSACSTNLYMG
jgi:hypothetical protein